MNRIKRLAALLPGFIALNADASDDAFTHIIEPTGDTLGFVVAPLNTATPVYLAAHRSHSSHASHSSHRSSAGSGSRSPSYSKSVPSYPSTRPSTPRSTTPSTPRSSDPLGRPSTPSTTAPDLRTSNTIMTPSRNIDVRESVIRQVQVKLIMLGYLDDMKNVDGILGPITRRAIRDYRSNHNLPSGERIDVALLNSMGIVVQ